MIYVYVFTCADIDRQTVIEVCCPLRVLLDMGSETRSGAERKPSGLTNHPKYHLHSSNVCLCCRNVVICLSASLSGSEDCELSVCPACVTVCLCVSYGSWHGGPLYSDKWLRLESALRPLGRRSDLTRTCVCGSVEREDTHTAPSSCTLVLIYKVLQLVTSILFLSVWHW